MPSSRECITSLLVVGGSCVHSLPVDACDMTQETNKGLGSSRNHICFFLKKKIYLIERTRERMHAEGEGVEGEKKRVLSRLCGECRTRCGAPSHGPEIMT